MQDKIGAPLNIGDVVVYAKKGDDGLHFAVIEEFVGSLSKSAKIRRVSTNRVSVNSRLCADLLSVETLKESNPEYFI